MTLNEAVDLVCRCCRKVVPRLVFAETCAECFNHCTPGSCTNGVGRIATTATTLDVGKD